MPLKSYNSLRAVKIKINKDGGFTIPPEFCEALGIKAADEILMAWKNDELHITKARPRKVGRRQRTRG